MARPAASEPITPAVPLASTVVVTTAALASRTLPRRGVAARVVWIMPVSYSWVTASTANTTTATWPAQRRSAAWSTPRPGPASCVPPPEQPEGNGQGDGDIGAEHAEPQPGALGEAAVLGEAEAALDGLLDGEPGAGRHPQQPAAGRHRQGGRHQLGNDQQHDDRGD